MSTTLTLHGFIHDTIPSLVKEIYDVSATLFKLMIPIIIIVKILEELGAIPYISKLLEPLMSLVGLPDSMGLVLTANLLSNMYAGMLVFYQMAPEESLTVAQVTVLCGMMLIAHSLPVEVRIAQKAGMRLAVALGIRLGGALLFGVLLDQAYRWGGWLQQPVELSWTPPPIDDSWSGWLVAQAQSLAMIVVIIGALISLLRLLRWLHIERLMIWLLQPVLRLLGICPKATSLTIIGITLGLAFGGGLLIREAQSGRISRRDVFSALCLLSLCHSLIEDTLLVLLLGADLSGVLWARLVFSLVFVAVMTRLIYRTSDSFQERFLFYSIREEQPAAKA
ncbi:nucleoside recognition domain-containing protein [Motiliproteus sp.]|uniref:nucleoside recognition domain-containing protein n=1 Tax=Motiliproteus sp. TaxID=1898955 RepID=UPI003BAA4565